MEKVNNIFDRIENLTQKEGQSDFVSVLITNLLNKDDTKKSIEFDVNSYTLLKTFIGKIYNAIDELSMEITNDDSILISVKNQKLLRTCFQIITAISMSTSLIPGLGVPLSKKSLNSAILAQMNFKDEEKYELLVDCTNFFTRSYKIPVLKNIIMTLHLSDYLAALIQLAFAPLRKPGTYNNFVMTQEQYDKLNTDRQQFISIYEHLVANCFQPTLMKELLILQSLDNPSPPLFVKKIISRELSRRLVASGGLLSLVRCFIESYDIDAGFEWKKIDMICRIVSAKHGTCSDNDYLVNITTQLQTILCLNNMHYITTAVACILRLNEKYPGAEPINIIVKDNYQAFDYDSLVLKSNLPGTIILSPQDIDHKVNILHACVHSANLDWHVPLLAPNLRVLFLVGIKCTENEELKYKVKEILTKCLEKFNKIEVSTFMNKILFEMNWQTSFNIEEYSSGIAIKSASSQNQTDNSNHENLLYFIVIFKSSTENEFIKSVIEISLEILLDLSTKRKRKANKDLLALEDHPILLDDIDVQYATILQLLSEISSCPKTVNILKANPSIVVNFVEQFMLQVTQKSDEESSTIALVLLNTVLASAKNHEFENKLTTIIPILKKMSQDESSFNHILCKEALSLMSSSGPQKPESACAKAITDVFDKLLPVRAHGIIELTKLIDAKDAETISKKHYLFCIFQEQLKDQDSYIYLSAVNGLASLCTHCTEDVLHVLCKEFLQLPSEHNRIQTNNEQNEIAELRMKIGDVIVKVTRRLGDMAIVHKTILLNTMLCACRDEDPLIRTSALSNLAEIALVLHYKMGTIIYEVLLCIGNIIETDKAIECRRSAVMVISSLLKGLGKETLIQLKENLLPIYRMLKSLYKNDDEDSTVRLHAQIALEELNDIVNQFLFPELKMEKKIFVLDKPE